jgi:two-component system, NtrC family, response regulator
VIEGKPKILIVEDDPGLQKQLKWCFDEFAVIESDTRAAATAALRRHEPAVVLQDLGLPPDPDGVSEGFATLAEILRIAPRTKVIVVTGKPDPENGVRAVAQGAYDFCQKPVDTDVLKLIVSRALRIHELEQQNEQLRSSALLAPFGGLIASDEPMQNVCRMIEKVAPTDVSVLLLGESGTGKELLARAIHDLSGRATERFQAINCAAIPEQLLESELFGHEKGSFTGAIRTTQGKIEHANRGTLFLDEIGDMPLPLQAKLLRFLQDRIVERVGGRAQIPVDVRVVCATNQDLQLLIAQQRFRQDLYYRIGEVIVNIPPLRDRPGGAAVLAHAFLRKFSAQQGRARRGYSDDAIQALSSYEWPGNVRELENKVKTAIIMAEGPLITAADLGLVPRESSDHVFNLREVRARAEKLAVHQALVMADSNVSRAAELLGITRPTLYDLMEKFGMRGSEGVSGD